MPLAESTDDDVRYYQLTHDFLVPSVRAWLIGLQTQTPAGRARARLQSLAISYASNGDKRFIPSFWEFIEIVRHVRPHSCSNEAKKLYQDAWKTYAFKTFAVAAAAVILLMVWRWNVNSSQRQVAEIKIDQWINARPEELNLASTIVAERQSISIPLMRSMLADQNLSQKQKMRLIIGLALTDAADASELLLLVDYVPACSYAELATLRRALKNNAPQTVPALEKRLEQTSDEEEQVKLAIVLFHLGKPSALLAALDNEGNAATRLLAIQAISTDQDDLNDYVSLLVERENEADDHDLLAGMVKGVSLCIGKYGNGPITAKWLKLCGDYFHRSPSGPMHSATQFALTRLGAEIPKVDQEKSTDGESEANWYVTPSGLTMIHIQADGFEVPEDSEERGLTSNYYSGETLSDFWISATEIPVGLFRRFDDSQGGTDIISRRWEQVADDLPVTDVNILEAMRFANWLSEQEGLEPYYEQSDEEFELQDAEKLQFEGFAQDVPWRNYKKWRIRPESDGYRLPGIGESYFLTLATQQPNLKSAALSRELLSMSAWFAENTDPQVLQPVGQLMPDSLGLFDTVGNAAELVVDKRFPLVRLEHLVSLDNFSELANVVATRPHTYTFLWVRGKTTSFRVVRNPKREK